MHRVSAIPMPVEREQPAEVRSAFDQNYDPYYGAKPEGQQIDGMTFADLRDDMDARRRRTARRTDRY